ANDCHTFHARRDLLEQLQPFRAEAELEEEETGGIAARPRQAVDKAGTNWISDIHKHDGHAAGRMPESRECFAATGQDGIGSKRDQFPCVPAHALGIALSPTIVDAQVAAISPPRLLKALPECRNARLRLRIVLNQARKHTDAPHPLGLLCPRRHRPRRRAAEERDELAAFHSITWSARASRVDGTSRPSVLAALRLRTSSIFTAC